MKFTIGNKKILKSIFIVVCWLVIWQMLYLAINDDMIIASPINVLICFFRFTASYSFWKTIFLSIIRIFSGFILAVFFGVLLAILTAGFKTAGLFIKPIILIIKSTPVVSLIILVTAFINTMFIPTFISFLMVLPVIWSNIYQGILHIDYRLLQMAKVFRIKNINIIKNIYLPNIMPYFISSINSGVGFAWKSGISAEILVKSSISIGAQVSISKMNMHMTELFTWTAIIVILCFLLEKIIILIMKILFNGNKLGGGNFVF